jgi:hypothetical protein
LPNKNAALEIVVTLDNHWKWLAFLGFDCCIFFSPANSVLRVGFRPTKPPKLHRPFSAIGNPRIDLELHGGPPTVRGAG